MIKLISILFLLIQIISLGSSTLTRLSTGLYLSKVELEFIQAYVVCKRNGLILATERNDAESANLNNTIKAAGQTQQNYWLGGINETRGELLSVWTWLDLDEDIQYEHWIPGWPKASDKNNCLLRNAVSSYNSGQWTSESCSEKHWFICQHS